MTDTEVAADVAVDAPAQANPLSEGLRQGRVPLPCVVVIFGATGDLTKRKLVPALYALAADGQLPPGFSIVGAGRTEQSTEDFRDAMREASRSSAACRCATTSGTSSPTACATALTTSTPRTGSQPCTRR